MLLSCRPLLSVSCFLLLEYVVMETSGCLCLLFLIFISFTVGDVCMCVCLDVCMPFNVGDICVCVCLDVCMPWMLYYGFFEPPCAGNV